MLAHASPRVPFSAVTLTLVSSEVHGRHLCKIIVKTLSFLSLAYLPYTCMSPIECLLSKELQQS